jgi:hypothetical protein
MGCQLIRPSCRNKFQAHFSENQFLLELKAYRIYNQPNYRNQKLNGRKMNASKSLLFMACLAFCFLAGCAQPEPHKVVEQICLSDTHKPKAMQIAEDVLDRMNFTIAKADTEQGLIRTKPLPAAQSFEFWRSDNVGSFNSTEANLHSIRRTAELDISRQGGQLCINCDVKVQRLSLPENEVTSSGRSYAMFTRSKQ